MVVLNADGSVPEMCGNGLRCVALFTADSTRSSLDAVTIETDAGSRSCRVHRHDGLVLVDADVGVVRVLGQRTLTVAGNPVLLTLADAGNPHAVVYAEDPGRALDLLGPALVGHSSFEHGTNVEFVRWTNGVLEVAVWERGVGPTMACGTGACAVAAVACARGETLSSSPVRVRLPGGELLVTHDPTTGQTRLVGPARRVFTGEWLA
jgi:diaminopimelate epimerase